jgi:hypothetical protein
VQTVRNLRAESGIDPARRIRLVVTRTARATPGSSSGHRGALATLARCGDIAVAGPRRAGPGGGGPRPAV